MLSENTDILTDEKFYRVNNILKEAKYHAKSLSQNVRANVDGDDQKDQSDYRDHKSKYIQKFSTKYKNFNKHSYNSKSAYSDTLYDDKLFSNIYSFIMKERGTSLYRLIKLMHDQRE
jgi:type III secretory pathway component EscR